MTNNVSIVYLTDYGQTNFALQQPTVTVGTTAGFDVAHNGSTSVAAGEDASYESTVLGGGYVGDVGSAPTFPLLITIPWYEWGSTTTKNTASAPDYLIGLDALSGTDSLVKVTGVSTAYITPAANTLPIGPNCAMIWKGTKIAILMDDSGDIRLYTTTTTGASWTDRGIIATSKYIRGRYFSNTGQQLFIATDSVLKYSANFGATLSNRTAPVSSALLGIEPVG